MYAVYKESANTKIYIAGPFEHRIDALDRADVLTDGTWELTDENGFTWAVDVDEV